MGRNALSPPVTQIEKEYQKKSRLIIPFYIPIHIQLFCLFIENRQLVTITGESVMIVLVARTHYHSINSS
ncbi:hypothetical protein SAMN05216378_1505 [Paenibacillus catalpae]|uniref:Uncharacterized protein n=1 Tax=Paenibacillus catalpae TaxID=1045775 RepID=A0A1I1VCN9_9BACL|nr:hypothetical protein SAMN05216378_1505 [Paenibacillus catalpae]